jgi:hypothetical protein
MDEITNLNIFRKFKKNQLSDKEKIVYGYHFIEDRNIDQAKSLLSSVSQHYYMAGIYKDLTRALVCYLAYKYSSNPVHSQESEFYLVVYKLTQRIYWDQIKFHHSGYFEDLRLSIFVD